MNAMSSTLVTKNRRTCRTSWLLRDRFVLRHLVDVLSLDTWSHGDAAQGRRPWLSVRFSHVTAPEVSHAWVP
jgi:hypothetical protein